MASATSLETVLLFALTPPMKEEGLYVSRVGKIDSSIICRLLIPAVFQYMRTGEMDNGVSPK